MSKDLTISSHHIDLWLTNYDRIVDERLLSQMWQLLSDTERWQEAQFYFADDRKRYIVTRAMVRTVLSRYAAVAPTDWSFSTNAYGRPAIANVHSEATGLGFNVSHTQGLIAVAVSRHRVLGIDVENVLTRSAPLDIANSFFSPMESAELASLPVERQQDRFFEYWTFKEAYIKARGMGLSIPLDQFSIHLSHGNAVSLSINPALSDNATRWSFWQLRPTSAHVLAICAERLDGIDPDLTVHDLVPLLGEKLLKLPVLKSSSALVAT